MTTTDDLAEPLLVELVRWQPHAGGGPLLGTVDLTIETALTIHNVAVVRMGNQLVLSLPARPVVDGSGHLVRDTSYAVVWEAVLSWRHQDEYLQFSETVIALLRARYPQAIPKGCRPMQRRDNSRPAPREAAHP